MKRLGFCLLLFLPSFAFGQGSIDSTGFRNEYKSILRYQEFERVFERNEEMAALYFATRDEDDWKSGREAVAEAIDSDEALLKEIRKVKPDAPYAGLQSQQIKTVELAVAAFRDLYQHGPDSKQFNQANDVYQPKLNKYLRTLVKLTDRDFVGLDSAQVALLRELEFNRAYIERAEIQRLLAAGKPQQAYDKLLSDPTFAQNDLALLLAADILLTSKFDSLLDPKLSLTKDSLGVAYLEVILGRGLYSPVLFEAWRKWRAMKQLDFGASKSSEIPNDLYDSTRFALLRMIAHHVETHASERWGYVQFHELLDAEIIHRFGPYPFGNQSAVERGILFYDK